MHLPHHPLWFWLIAFGPLLFWVALWVVANYGRVSLKPLGPWLRMGALLFVVPYVFLAVSDNHKLLKLELWSIYWAFIIGSGFITGRGMFETLRAPSKWPMPWDGVRFSVLRNACIPVQDINAVAPWYVEKLGLREVPNPLRDTDAQTYKFNEDGKSVTLTTKPALGLDRTLILFTKKIGKMKAISV